jgi:hypothetical protein
MGKNEITNEETSMEEETARRRDSKRVKLCPRSNVFNEFETAIGECRRALLRGETCKDSSCEEEEGEDRG